MNTETIKADTNLIARCGLYCGACSRHLKGKCPGCTDNKKATWCKVRSCTLEKEIASCAACDEFDDPMQCKKYNTFMGKVFALIFNSDRGACIQKLKKDGPEKFAGFMAAHKQASIKRR